MSIYDDTCIAGSSYGKCKKIVIGHKTNLKVQEKAIFKAKQDSMYYIVELHFFYD